MQQKKSQQDSHRQRKRARRYTFSIVYIITMQELKNLAKQANSKDQRNERDARKLYK